MDIFCKSQISLYLTFYHKVLFAFFKFSTLFCNRTVEYKRDEKNNPHDCGNPCNRSDIFL